MINKRLEEIIISMSLHSTAVDNLSSVSFTPAASSSKQTFKDQAETFSLQPFTLQPQLSIYLYPTPAPVQHRLLDQIPHILFSYQAAKYLVTLLILQKKFRASEIILFPAIRSEVLVYSVQFNFLNAKYFVPSVSTEGRTRIRTSIRQCSFNVLQELPSGSIISATRISATLPSGICTSYLKVRPINPHQYFYPVLSRCDSPFRFTLVFLRYNESRAEIRTGIVPNPEVYSWLEILFPLLRYKGVCVEQIFCLKTSRRRC